MFQLHKKTQNGEPPANIQCYKAKNILLTL